MTSRKRVLFATHKFGRFGGLEIYNLDAAHALQKLGAEVQAVSVFLSGRNVCEGVPHTGLVPTNPLLRRIYWRTWRRWFALALRILYRRFDLAIAGHVMVLPQVASYAKKNGIPCWLLVFGIDIWGDWSTDIEKAIYECNRIIALSQYTANSVRRRLDQGQERVVVIHPQVDVNKFSPGNEMGERDKKIILTVSRLAASERYKGHDLIISALPTVCDALKHPVEYWIVGDGDDRRRLEQLAQERGVMDIVKFKGAVWGDERVEFFRACDVFAMPSYVEQRPDGRWTGEGFGIVYIEAAACGKPVIACDVGGQTDAVIDGVTGILVKPTVDSVAGALIELLKDREKARRMGEAGRRFVVERFSEEVFTRKWATLLNQLQ